MDLRNSIKKALNSLSQSQARDGSFSTYTFAHSAPNQSKRPISTTFVTANILHTLSFYKDKPDIQKKAKKASDFLLQQQDLTTNTLNYWKRKSKEFRKFPIPDDLDCSVVAFAALQEHDTYTGEKIIKNMINLEVKEGGPYYTWLTNNKNWKHLELGVNLNTLWYCLLNDIYLPNLIKYIYKEIQNESQETIFYPCCTIWYLLSRAYHDGKWEEVEKKRIGTEKINVKAKDIKRVAVKAIKKLLKKKHSDIEVACLTLALVNFGYSDSMYVQKLLAKQKRNGSWEMGTFNFGHNSITKETKSGDGSSELTTALALEALTKYDLLINPKSSFLYPEFEKDYELVKANFGKWQKLQPKNLRPALAKISKKILNEKFTIRSALLPFFYSKSLNQKNISKKFLVDLGVNNVIGWIGYYLEDKQIDDNLKDPTLLQIMNVCKSHFLNFLKTNFAGAKDYLSWLNEAEEIYKNTIGWELSKTRFKGKYPKKLPDYKDFEVLADRSLPFTYSTAALAAKVKTRINSSKFKALIGILRHHLIVKQINDDAHDWEEDLKEGRATSVLSLALKKSKGKKPQNLITNKVIVEVAEIMRKHLKAGRYLSKKAKLKKPDYMYNLNSDLETIPDQLMHEVRIVEGL